MNPILSKEQIASFRRCDTRRELAKKFKGAELAEAWRILQLQKQRYEARNRMFVGGCDYGGRFERRLDQYPGGLADRLEPRIRRSYEQRGLRQRSDTAFDGQVANFLVWKMPLDGKTFAERIAEKIMRSWPYRWQDKKYWLAVRHSRTEKSVKHTRPACGYDTFFTAITFDLLREEAVVIGGLLTIRRKADAKKRTYGCRWFERRADGPGLILRRGQIIKRNHHVENAEDVEARRAAARERGAAYRKANAAEITRRRLANAARDKARRAELRQRALEEQVASAKPPRGWVTRARSIAAGNCAAGTDQFVRNDLAPYLQKLGYDVGNLAGAAVRKSDILKLRKDQFTRRL